MQHDTSQRRDSTMEAKALVCSEKQEFTIEDVVGAVVKWS